MNTDLYGHTFAAHVRHNDLVAQAERSRMLRAARAARRNQLKARRPDRGVGAWLRSRSLTSLKPLRARRRAIVTGV
jgi:hypothetical protein